MDWNDYVTETNRNAREWLEENIECNDDFDEAFFYMGLDDSVTGNASGSFYCNAYKAEQAVCGIVFDPYVFQVFRDAGYSEGIPTELGPETCDVLARCLALDESYGELEELFYSLKKGSEEEDEDAGSDDQE